MIATISFAVCASLLLTVICQLKPVYGVLGGVFITLALAGGAVTLISEFIDSISDMLAYEASEYIILMLKVAGVSICADVGADLCAQLGYSSIAKTLHLYGKVYILLISAPVLRELLEDVYSLF